MTVASNAPHRSIVCRRSRRRSRVIIRRRRRRRRRPAPSVVQSTTTARRRASPDRRRDVIAHRAPHVRRPGGVPQRRPAPKRGAVPARDLVRRRHARVIVTPRVAFRVGSINLSIERFRGLLLYRRSLHFAIVGENIDRSMDRRSGGRDSRGDERRREETTSGGGVSASPARCRLRFRRRLVGFVYGVVSSRVTGCRRRRRDDGRDGVAMTRRATTTPQRR